MKAHAHPCVGCRKPVSCTQECLSNSHRNQLAPPRPDKVCDRCLGVDRAARKAKRRAELLPKPKAPKTPRPRRPLVQLTFEEVA